MTKLAVIGLLALLCVSTFATQTRLTSAQEKKIKELKDNKWGKIIFSLAELHVQSEGPFEDLIETVESLISDLGDSIDDADETYNERSLQHQSEVTRLEGEITDAEVAIANAENLLDNVLYPALEQLTATRDGYNDEVNENNAYVERITYEREEAHTSYEQRVAEHNDALSAIDECLEILGGLSGGLSLIQVKRVQSSIHKVTQKLKRGVEETLVKALVSLASQEFADQGALLRVINALEDVKQGVLDALDLEHTNEATSVAQYESEVAEREEDNKRLAREINITNGEIDATENRIAQKETFLNIRRADLAQFQADLEAENNAFEEATAFYEDVRAELVREQAVANDCLSILSNAGFSASITKNIGF
jgi:predicted  nucleic acid-binding Zn-ribbon protein